MNELVFGKLVDELKLRGRSEGTISAYKTEVLRFVKDFARPLDELSIQDIKVYQLKLIEAGYKNRTVNLRMTALRFFCLHVLEKDWVEKLTPRMKESKTLPNHLSPGEVAALICSCESRLERVLLMMIYATGQTPKRHMSKLSLWQTIISSTFISTARANSFTNFASFNFNFNSGLT